VLRLFENRCGESARMLDLRHHEKYRNHVKGYDVIKGGLVLNSGTKNVEIWDVSGPKCRTASSTPTDIFKVSHDEM